MNRSCLLIVCFALLSMGGVSGKAAWYQDMQEEPLQRETRDTTNSTESVSVSSGEAQDGETNDNSGDGRSACRQAHRCVQRSPAVRLVSDLVGPFNIQGIYPNIDGICAGRSVLSDCFGNISCPDHGYTMAPFMGEVIIWICDHATGFRDGAQCFAGPFSRMLRGCRREIHRGGRRADIYRNFRNCINNVVYSLPACNVNNRGQFFMSFFDFVTRAWRRN